MAEEYIVGEVSSENNYSEDMDTPTIFDFWNKTEDEGIKDTDLIAVVPFGKVGSDKRMFGSKTAIIQKSDILAVLYDMAGGDRAKSAIMWLDPEYTGPFLKSLLFLHNNPVHITGIGFKRTS